MDLSKFTIKEVPMKFYIPDLSYHPRKLSVVEKEMNLISVGWLDAEHPYNTGNVPLEFIKRLESFCSNAIIRTFGVELCPLCDNNEFVVALLSTGKKIQLFGAYELRIPSDDRRKIYVAPDFILHYVTTHCYKPPQEFIDAVVAAPLPGTPEYEEFSKPWKKYH